MPRVAVRPELLRWAVEGAGCEKAYLSDRFPRLGEWESGKTQPTLKQLEKFAGATHVPIGYLFLKEPPEETVPLPDMRTMRDREIEKPSRDLLDTVYLCQQQQDWYCGFARIEGEPERTFVGSASLEDDVKETATKMRRALGFNLEERTQPGTWTAALRRFIEQADGLGVLVMVSGVVGTNNHRRLNPEEFRGFALCDDFAPLVFVNGADTKAAQMFTLAHELAHLWLGESALSNVALFEVHPHSAEKVERWCNQVAAELLVPLSDLRKEYRKSVKLEEELDRLARHFKVSTLVVLRRLNDAGVPGLPEPRIAYEQELRRPLRSVSKAKGGGGNFYLTQMVRTGKRFARALVVSTFEGQTSFTEAFRLLGVKNVKTMRNLGTRLGIGA